MSPPSSLIRLVAASVVGTAIEFYDGDASRSRAHAGRILRVAEGREPPALQEHSDPLVDGGD
jgi:hypothetical protein